MTLQEKLEQLPEVPGVYLFRDVAGDVAYVGKAQSLRSRVRSYFQRGSDLSPRIKLLVDQVRDLLDGFRFRRAVAFAHLLDER